MINTPILDKIRYLSSGDGKLELHNTTGIVCASNDPKELADAWRQAAEHLRKRANYFGMKIKSRILTCFHIFARLLSNR